MQAPALVGDDEVDALIEARATIRQPLKRFAVIFTEKRPRKLSLPTLWVSDLAELGEWILSPPQKGRDG